MIAMVTGASAGFGAAISRTLVQRGEASLHVLAQVLRVVAMQRQRLPPFALRAAVRGAPGRIGRESAREWKDRGHGGPDHVESIISHAGIYAARGAVARSEHRVSHLQS